LYQLLGFYLMFAAAFLAGCGGGTSTLTGNTSVTVLATNTANDQLSQFSIVINKVTLTSQAGKTVDLIASPVHVEFTHLNGTAEPLITTSVPQDVYTSATATVGVSGFACVALKPPTNALQISYFTDATMPGPTTTVNFPAPITIAGANMSLSLDLLASESASWTSCTPSSIEPYSITPTFNLASVRASSVPTSSTGIKLSGLHGRIAAVDSSGGGFSVTAGDGPGCIAQGGGCISNVAGPTWPVIVNGNTVYQGIGGLSQLAAGMPVVLDATIQQDGSLLATQIAVFDTNTDNLTMVYGPILYRSAAYPNFQTFPMEEQGPLGVGWSVPFSFSNSTVFQVSDQFANLRDLPFTPNFSTANMVDGQQVAVSTHALSVANNPINVPATTVTLMPQTINGTVNAISNEGEFTTYSVTLADYSLFPTLATQGGQPSADQPTNPNSVVVYTDRDTQMLNTNPIAVGRVVRFYGLIFNDNGTLRMDCARVSDGVPQ
jgi:hypothetical protein